MMLFIVKTKRKMVRGHNSNIQTVLKILYQGKILTHSDKGYFLNGVKIHGRLFKALNDAGRLFEFAPGHYTIRLRASNSANPKTIKLRVSE